MRLTPLSASKIYQPIALWCNGSTSDSGSACEGSNPSRTTKTNGENTSPFIFLITNKFKLTIFNGNKD